MILNFAIAIVSIWLLIYIGAYLVGFKYMGLVTREHDGQYELLEFYYNAFVDEYKVRLICRGTEKTYNMWNGQHNITEIHKMIEEVKLNLFSK